MIPRFLSASILTAAIFCTGCGTNTDRTVVVSGNQGSYVLKREPNPLAGQAHPGPASPTTKEVSQQRRIDELEAQSRQLQSEIERLKREKTASP